MKFRKPEWQCSREKLKGKKDKWKEKRKREKRADRLQKKDYLQIKVDQVLRNDRLGVLTANEHKMTPIG